MADTDQSLYNLRYNQVTQGMEGFGGGSPMWTPLALSGAGTPPAGADTQIQYNNMGAFGASPNLTYGIIPVQNYPALLVTGTNTIGGSIHLGHDTNGGQCNFTNSDGSVVYSSVNGDNTGAIFVQNAIGLPTLGLWVFGIDGGLQLNPVAAEPDAPVEGEMIYNSTLHKLQFYNGTAWETVTSV